MGAYPKATRATYETGLIVNGGGGLGQTPILDLDVVYSDFAAAGDVHMKYYHFSTRERIRNANGHADNMVMWNGVLSPRSNKPTTLVDGCWTGNTAPFTFVAEPRLRTVDAADYTVAFTPAEIARLQTIFPTGVCNYARTGFDPPDLLSTWLEYTGVGTYKKDRGPQE